MSSGSDDPGYVEGEPTTPFKPAPLGLRSLLGWQYRNSIEDLLGEAAAAKVVVPDDTPLNGFDAIGASQLSLSTRSVETYEQSARAAAKAVFAKAEARDRVLGCTPKSATDEACWTTFIRGFGRLAWRRSLTEEEVASWVSVGKSAGSAYGGFNRAAELVLAGLLQSPNFLNQVETGEPDPADPDRLRLTGVELASRVSYFLNGTTPSEALIAAAEAGELDTAEGIRQHARALLESPRARQAVARLFDEVFDLRHLEDLTKLEPYAASPSLLAAMRQESQLLVEKTAFEDNSDFRTIFGADYTYVNKELADHYGLEGAPAEGFVRLPLPPETGRAGFLGHASFLSLNAHPANTSPTHRGKFIRERVLCQSIPNPPQNVITVIPETGDGPRTMRERLQTHQNNPTCAGCHALMDGVGLALENYDPVGRFRETDQGLPIDAVSTVPDLGSFASPRELGSRVAADERVGDCLTRNLFRAAAGHLETDGEAKPLYRMHHAFVDSGFKLQALLVELVASDAFRYGSPQL